MLALLAALPALGALACDDTGPTDPAPDVVLPAEMSLIATASGNAGGLTVQCGLAYVVKVTRQGAVWSGEWGGEAQRSVVDATGAGISFFALAHAELRLTAAREGALVLTSYRDGKPLMPDGTSRFWDEIVTLRGTLGADRRTVIGEGSWTCRPMDARGDSLVSVPGTWRLEVR